MGNGVRLVAEYLTGLRVGDLEGSRIGSSSKVSLWLFRIQMSSGARGVARILPMSGWINSFLCFTSRTSERFSKIDPLFGA